MILIPVFVAVHEFLQVQVEVLEHKVQTAPIRSARQEAPVRSISRFATILCGPADMCKYKCARLQGRTPAVSVHHILQSDHIVVAQLLEQRDLPDGCGRHALLFLL